MVIASLHHEEQVETVSLVDRWQFGRFGFQQVGIQNTVTRVNRRRIPAGHPGGWCINVCDQRINIGCTQLLAKGWHLCCL